MDKERNGSASSSSSDDTGAEREIHREETTETTRTTEVESDVAHSDDASKSERRDDGPSETK